jgi:hypothetical protein
MMRLDNSADEYMDFLVDLTLHSSHCCGVRNFEVQIQSE